MSNDKFKAYVKTQAFAAQMAEFGFTVQVLVQKVDERRLEHFAYGSGNLFARREHARRWIKQQEQDDYMETIGMKVIDDESSDDEDDLHETEAGE